MASKRKRLDKTTLIVLGAVLGAEIVGCSAVVMGIHTRKSGMEQTLAGKETALQNVRTVSAGLPALQREYRSMQAQVRFLESALPPTEYIPTLLGQVEQVAKRNGVQIQEFRPKPAPPTPPGQQPATSSASTQQVFDMIVCGDYGQMQRFLRDLTQFRKILALNALRLQPAATTPAKQTPKLTGNLTFTAYVLAPAAPAAPATAVRPVTAAAPGQPGQQVATGQGLGTPAAPRG